MFETFDTDHNNDSNISEISFSDKQCKFTMEIIARNTKEAIALKGRIFSLRGIYEMDSPTYQNFTIECNEEKAIVRLSGNIANALNILIENKLISIPLQSEISKNGNVTNFLHETSTFILPENIEKSPEAAKPNPLENISALQERVKLQKRSRSVTHRLMINLIFIRYYFLSSRTVTFP